MKKIPSLISPILLRDILRSSSSRQQKISILETDFNKQFQVEFYKSHIPKAHYFDQLECTTPTKTIPRGLPDFKCIESHLSKLGISNSDHIVLYDRSPAGLYASSRAWWLFKILGMDNLSILNGGFRVWMKEVNEDESSNNKNSKSEEIGNFKVYYNETMLKKYEDMLNIVTNKSKKQQIVDARSSDLFNGPNAGHLPNSLNLPYNSLFSKTDETLKSIDELKHLFKRTGVDLSKPTIYTCQTGTTASTLAFIAHLLGQTSLSVYNGSFTEWQNCAPKELIHHDSSTGPAA